MEFKEIKYENPLTLEIGKSPDSELIKAANSYIFSNYTEMPGKLILLDGTVLTSKEDMKTPLYTYLASHHHTHMTLGECEVGESFETLNGPATVTAHTKYGCHVSREPSGVYSFSRESCIDTQVWWEHK